MSHYSINYYQSQAIRSTMKLWWLQHLTGKGNSNLRRSMHLPSLFNGTILVSISAALSEVKENSREDQVVVYKILESRIKLNSKLKKEVFKESINFLELKELQLGCN
ncbi:uncharacterized protein LOC120092826 isoform X6 [Benincasa hispida]|uniref:uncharacterized protein LOC120092826 isoform X6 n=1 Tax=Benincasa hispida TaxID=102211 RepID=UPI001901FC15|nr:uncharacterized protein LOC120092826 isoform X6 [Benincasa hispida]